MRIIVYGTLRQGDCREHVVEGLRQAGTSELMVLYGLKMYAFGRFPGVIVTKDPGDFIVAEIIDGELPAEEEKMLNRRLDSIEGIRQTGAGEDVGLYKRVMWDTPKGPALIYVFNRDVEEDCPVITDWMKWISKEKKSMMAAE